MAKLIELFGRLDARQISSVCEESGSHVTIASTEPQHRTGLSGIRTEANNLDGLASRLQFLIVAASIGIILWLVSALCNGGFDKHFEQISSVNRTAAACMQYREIAVDRCPHR